jgi:hypothetical protein
VSREGVEGSEGIIRNLFALKFLFGESATLSAESMQNKHHAKDAKHAKSGWIEDNWVVEIASFSVMGHVGISNHFLCSRCVLCMRTPQLHGYGSDEDCMIRLAQALDPKPQNLKMLPQTSISGGVSL